VDYERSETSRGDETSDGGNPNVGGDSGATSGNRGAAAERGEYDGGHGGTEGSAGGESGSPSRPRTGPGSRGGTGSRSRGAAEGAQKVSVDLEEPAKPASKVKVPASMMDVAKLFVWATDMAVVSAMPLVSHPEIPPTALKQIWAFDDVAIEAIAKPVATLLMKMPVKARKRLEAIAPGVEIVQSIGEVLLPRYQATMEVLARCRAPRVTVLRPDVEQGPPIVDAANIRHDDFKTP
jgi:hypothetical protein